MIPSANVTAIMDELVLIFPPDIVMGIIIECLCAGTAKAQFEGGGIFVGITHLNHPHFYRLHALATQ